MFSAAKTARPSGGYTVGRSLRFRSSASAYLNRTFTTPTNNKIWTWSGWVKRGALGVTSYIMEGYPATAGNTNDRTQFYFTSGDALEYSTITTGTTTELVTTTQVFRDPSAWYHIIIVCDTTQATASNRLKFYVNGVQITAFSNTTYPALNANPYIDAAKAHYIGAAYNGSLIGGVYFDGYLAEVNFVDGQALTPSSFGAYDTNGVWQPAKYTGTYGTNGFYLNFGNTTSTTTLGYDTSGNSNNWTTNNISLTAGTTYDSMIDSPTVSASSSNYCVLNPLNRSTSALPATVVDGNLKLTTTTSGAGSPGAFSYAMSTMIMDSGKYYAEFTPVYFSGSAGSTKVGLTNNFTFNYNGGNYIASNFTSAYTQQAPGNIVQVAYDATNGLYWFGVNGTFTGNPAAGTGGTSLAGPAMFFVEGYNDSTNRIDMNANFGQRPFSYTPPTGFSALNTYNLPTPTIANGAQYMAATLYTGTGSSQAIANSQSNGGNNALGKTFYPDLTWIKSRSAATDHKLTDSVRGVTKALISDTTGAETTDANGLTAFSSSSFTVGSDTTYNNNGATYVGWQWNAGSGSSSSNTSGTITSTVSANTTAGFSVVTYTGTGANATVGHGLGVAPSMIIVKVRNLAGEYWPVRHTSIAATNGVYLNATDASGATTDWNNTAPTSTVFSIGTNNRIGGAYNYVAYCFAAVRGYSAFGSYTGNGSTDGPFVYTGFRPRWVMIKRTDSTSDWYIWDTSRDTYNVVTATLLADTAGAETSATSIDNLSNGFKCRSATVTNASSGTYVYAAFAENPFNSSRAR